MCWRRSLILTIDGHFPVFQPGANHYRFLGLELTRPAGTQGARLVSVTQVAAAAYIVLDRIWLHGTDAG